MRALICLLLTGCMYFEPGGHRAPTDDPIPTLCGTMLSTGDSCSSEGEVCSWGEGIDGGTASEQHYCTCSSHQWYCQTTFNSCPSDWRDPEATCTPGEGCSYSDWEHGCECSCSPSGHWNCTNETVGSMCPHELPDGGL